MIAFYQDLTRFATCPERKVMRVEQKFCYNDFMRFWSWLRQWLRLDAPPETRAFYLQQDVLQELETLARRERRPPEELANRLLSEVIWERRAGQMLERWYRLTPREQEVAALICLGCTTQQIADRLTVSHGTIKGYAHHILEKFAVHSRAELRELLAQWDFSEWKK
jgi:DNA-binding CsgD family transcriptional regulator